MKAMIMDMRILTKHRVFMMFWHVADVGAGKRRGLPASLQHYKILQASTDTLQEVVPKLQVFTIDIVPSGQLNQPFSSGAASPLQFDLSSVQWHQGT